MTGGLYLLEFDLNNTKIRIERCSLVVQSAAAAGAIVWRIFSI